MRTENEKMHYDYVENKTTKSERVIKRLVEVAFNDYKSYSYLSDLENIKVGDLVTVEGKLSEKVGKVIKVAKSFKMPKFEMKWVEAILDRDISGNYFKCGDDLISYDSSLTPEKFIAIYAGKKFRSTPMIGEKNLNIDLLNFDSDTDFIGPCALEKGRFLSKYHVLLIVVKNGVGKAIVIGSDYYEIDFKISGDTITSIACDCPCLDECKHVAAVLYKLRAIKKNVKDFNNFMLCERDNLLSLLLRGCGEVKIQL